MRVEGAAYSCAATKLEDSDSVQPCIEEKRFSLVFPEGNVFQGDRKILASKLRSIGVIPESRPVEEFKEQFKLQEEKGGGNLLKPVSFAEVLNRGKRPLGDAFWIESETGGFLCNLESLKKCPVGRWDCHSSCVIVLDSLKFWARYSWSLEGDL